MQVVVAMLLRKSTDLLDPILVTPKASKAMATPTMHSISKNLDFSSGTPSCTFLFHSEILKIN